MIRLHKTDIFTRGEVAKGFNVKDIKEYYVYPKGRVPAQLEEQIRGITDLLMSLLTSY